MARPRFTPREEEVLARLQSGATNPEIGRQLGISKDTVKHLLRSCYLKLGVSTRREAMAALRRGRRPLPRVPAQPRLNPVRVPSISPEDWERLTPSVRRALALRMEGLSNAEAAMRLGVRPDTVKRAARVGRRLINHPPEVG